MTVADGGLVHRLAADAVPTATGAGPGVRVITGILDTLLTCLRLTR